MRPSHPLPLCAWAILVLLLAELPSANAASAAYQLAFTTQPAGTVVGAKLTNVVVQIQNQQGASVTQGGTVIALNQSRGTGLSGVTSAATDTTGKATFTNLSFTVTGVNDALQASSPGLKSATSGYFTISKGNTSTTLTVSTNSLVYGQPVTFTATLKPIAPAVGQPTGSVSFKDGGTTLGSVTINASGVATFSTNKLSAATSTHTLTAVYNGDTNFLTSTSSNLLESVSKLALTVSGITASNKVYDGTTSATIYVTNAVLTGMLSNDTVTLNVAAAKGAFATKSAGVGKTVNLSGLTLGGVSSGNYSLTQPTTTATISNRSLTITAKGVNKVYDATTQATVTLTDNHLAGDLVTDAWTTAVFTNKNAGNSVLINVSGLTIFGNDAANYTLAVTSNTATANITKATLTVSGILASNKVYDGTTAATLNTSNAALATVLGGDVVALTKTGAKGVFANKTVGTGKTVTVSGLAISGTDSGNYSLTQPTSAANITARTLTVTATGINKIYDGTTNATVTLTDNRVSGDVLTNNAASAAFVSKNAGSNIVINVTGLTLSGPDAGNYVLAATQVSTKAKISPATLTVTANNFSRAYGTTNPVLTVTDTGFVTGESLAHSDVIGTPAVSTAAVVGSPIGTYAITVNRGTLASTNYSFTLVNGVLTVTPANTAAQISTTANPALTNQTITFSAAISPMLSGTMTPTGLVQFKCNGTNRLGNAVSLSGGQASVNVLAASLGLSNAVITAEYSDPAGNYNGSTNSLTQLITLVSAPPAAPTISLTPGAVNGSVTANLSGTAGGTYIIEASTDLVHWTPLATNVADANGNLSLIDSNAVIYPVRFYRGCTP